GDSAGELRVPRFSSSHSKLTQKSSSSPSRPAALLGTQRSSSRSTASRACARRMVREFGPVCGRGGFFMARGLQQEYGLKTNRTRTLPLALGVNVGGLIVEVVGIGPCRSELAGAHDGLGVALVKECFRVCALLSVVATVA